MYADDIVLLADSEHDLQSMLDVFHLWSGKNAMQLSVNKTKVVHFRPKSIGRTEFQFKIGNAHIDVIEKYVYLGLTLNEFLDYNVTARCVSQSAGRALGLLIAKSKSLGSMPYKVYSKLYDTMVWPVIAYGAAVWGDKTFTCIEAVQNKAMRFFLGTGRYTPNAAVIGEMGWLPPIVKQWKCVCLHWARLHNMCTSRINKQIFQYCFTKGSRKCKNNGVTGL